MTETLPAQRGTIAPEEVADLRRVGISPDFWYPVAVSASVRRGKTFAARFAGERIALYRTEGGVVRRRQPSSPQQKLRRCAYRSLSVSGSSSPRGLRGKFDTCSGPPQ